METHISGITEKEFQAYENVRVSGVTNMFNITYVSELSGLGRSKILTIIESYTKLMEFYPSVRR